MSALADIAISPSAHPSEIVVQERSRRDLGDLQALAESITRVGLLHPIVIDNTGVLIAGERRLRAWQIAFPDDSIPVRVIAGLEDATAALIAERDENTCRKDMTWSEKLALGARLEELERRKALDRMAQGGRSAAPGRPAERYGPRATPLPAHTVRDEVGAALGVGGRSYERVKSIQRTVETDSDSSVQEVAREQMDRLDEGASIRSAEDAVRKAQGKAEPKPKPERKRIPASDRIHNRHNGGKVQDTVPAGLNALHGLCLGFDGITTADLGGITAESLAEWSARVEEARLVLRNFNRRIREVTG